MSEFLVRIGINWPDGAGGEHRAEPGEQLSADDLEEADVDGLVALGALEARLSKDELYALAQEHDVAGRSKMSRDQLEAALAEVGAL